MSGPKRTAARRVASLFGSGFVAPRSQPHFGGCSLVASRQNRKSTQQTGSYLWNGVLNRSERVEKLFGIMRPSATQAVAQVNREKNFMESPLSFFAPIVTMNRLSVLLLLSSLRLRVGVRVRVRKLQPSPKQALFLPLGSWRKRRHG